MKDLTIGVVGAGVVGSAVARSYLEHVKEVRVYDNVKVRSTHDLSSTLESDIIFLCLPTPLGQSGLGLDVSAIDGFLKNQLPDRFKNQNFVLRSTVPIGTTRRLAVEYGLPNLVHSPEFLTARCATVDAMIPARNVIGNPQWGKSGMWADELEEHYRFRWPWAQVFHTSSAESEAVKLFQNGFFATKIAYWNECRTLADKIGLDWESMMVAILADGRIHPSHTQVPGPDGKFGFGGACLPKDLLQLIVELDRNGLRADVTSAAILRNGYDRKEQP